MGVRRAIATQSTCRRPACVWGCSRIHLVVCPPTLGHATSCVPADAPTPAGIPSGVGSGGGDVGGDGRPDVLVGTPSFGTNVQGAVWVVSVPANAFSAPADIDLA